MAETGQSASLREAYEAARREYGENLERLRTQVNTERGTHDEMVRVFAIGFEAATVDLMRLGLDIYLEAAAKDRASVAMALVQQEKDRRTMSRLTVAIAGAAIASAFGTLWAAFHPPRAAPAPAPVVNVAAPSPVVVPAPIVNVTIPPRAR